MAYGDINKCRYCTDEDGWKHIQPLTTEVVGDEPGRRYRSAVEDFLTDDGRTVEMMVGYGNLVVWIDGIDKDGEGESAKTTGITFPVNFCPICGRKLD